MRTEKLEFLCLMVIVLEETVPVSLLVTPPPDFSNQNRGVITEDHFTIVLVLTRY